jgi:hypothetical protein
MKSNVTLCVLLLVFGSIIINAQIVNSGFEDWDSNGNPIGWSTNNTPPTFLTIIKTNDAHSGSWAVEGDVVAFSVFTIPPSLINGEEGQGVPVNIRPAALEGYYKLISVQEDFLFIQAYLIKNGEYAGLGAAILPAADAYTKFSFEITPGSEIPDSALIAISIANSIGITHVGTKLFIDDLAWSGTTDVQSTDQTPNSFSLKQNYPNPFNPSTRIQYQVASNSQVTLKVYDLLGNELAVLVDEFKPAGSHEVEFNASELSSGIYLYKLQAGNFIETKKLMLLK